MPCMLLLFILLFSFSALFFFISTYSESNTRIRRYQSEAEILSAFLQQVLAATGSAGYASNLTPKILKMVKQSGNVLMMTVSNVYPRRVVRD